MENNKISAKTQNTFTNIIALRWWLGSLFVLLTAIFIQMLASFYPQEVENYYSRGIYPYIGQTLSLLNRLVWFSLAEFLLGLLSIGVIAWAIWQLRQLYQNHLTRKELLVKTLWYFISVFSIGLMFFLLLWGLNYQKQPLVKNLNLVSRQPNTTELIEVCQVFISATNQSYKEAIGNTNDLINNQTATKQVETKASKLPVDWIKLNNIVEESFQKEVLLKNITSGSYGPAKAVYFSGLMSQFGISGIFIPLTGEPNVNIAQTDAPIPFTLAHEKAHQRGFALEDEANFLAFLVCIKSENAYCRYSGYLMATTYLLSNLRLVAPEKYQELYKMLNIGPKSDLKAIYKFWAQYQGKLSETSEKINNAYLKANRVRSGIKNYNQVVDLIISYYFTYLSSKHTDDLDTPIGDHP